MVIKTAVLNIKTDKMFTKITDEVKKLIKESHIFNGTVTIFSQHTTACIKITEDCRLAHKDCELFIEKLVPKCVPYAHDWLEFRDVPKTERINGFAHVRQLMFNTSETIPIMYNMMLLGKWQDIFLVELDGNRDREVIVQIMGEE